MLTQPLTAYPLKTAVTNPWPNRNTTFTQSLRCVRILLAGSVKPDLLRLLSRYCRDQLNYASTTDDYPTGLFSGSSYDRLRQHLGFTETNIHYPVGDEETDHSAAGLT